MPSGDVSTTSRYSAARSMQSSRPNDRGCGRLGSGLAVDEVLTVLVDQLEAHVVRALLPSSRVYSTA